MECEGSIQIAGRPEQCIAGVILVDAPFKRHTFGMIADFAPCAQMAAVSAILVVGVGIYTGSFTASIPRGMFSTIDAAVSAVLGI
jgi:hypothetical protein